MRGRIVCLLCVVLLSVSGCGADVDVILQNGSPGEERDEADEPDTEGNLGEPLAAEKEEEYLSEICVYICGAVNEPGVFELPAGSRIFELLELAGGFTEDADSCSVNLARVVEDGEMIRIPTAEESAEGFVSDTDPFAGQGSAGTENGKVNINTAGVEELTSLNGIGEVKAAAIVAYREEHGFFRSTEEIMEVDGIAEGTYAKIKDQITV